MEVRKKWIAGFILILFKFNSSWSESEELGSIYTWHDGSRERVIQLVPNKMAEFKEGGAMSIIESPKQKSPHQIFSPVFRDGLGGGGRMRALPGNVIVTLNPNWSQAQIERWVTDHHLVMLRQMQNAPHVLLIKSEPGMSSLQVANELYESGEVVAASPNWWNENRLR